MTDRGDATAKTVLADQSTPGDSSAVEVVLRPIVAGRYEVIGLIGAGAMGTVYRARDRELDEIVALKVLKKELAGASGMLDRFRREVKLARRVTHRNVARTFDIGEDAGDRFLTMELVEGESLARRLARFGRLPLAEIVPLAKDICAGLGVAHTAGVLHRDLKPDNVIVALDGRAVITDFGIARAVAEGDAKTAVGSFVGTPLYMAPEQVEGTVELDARADLYALGAMLYELLIGEPAWQRPTIMAVAAARLLSPPPDPRAKLPGVPDDFAALVIRLMARDRDQRPRNAAEVEQVLASLAAPPTPPSTATTSEMPRAESDRKKKRVTVLPLETSDEDAWLSFGVVEELVEVLGRADGLVVREAPPTMRSLDRDGRELGRILDVDAVVTGSARREADRVQITLRLATVEDGFQLWASSLTRPLAELGLIADEAATAIAAALTTRAVISPRGAVDGGVEELLLRGRYILYRGVGMFQDQCVHILREAHERAPNDARVAGSYAIALARAYRSEHTESGVAAEARKVALHALELDATRPESRVALGTMHLADGEGEKAAIEVASALRVAPSSVDALDTMGRLLAEAGAAKEGLRLIELALSKEDIAIAKHLRIRTNILLGDWERLHEMMGELPIDPSAARPSALLWMRFMTWCTDEKEAKKIGRATTSLALAPDLLATMEGIAADPWSTAARQAVRELFDRAVKGMPKRAARGRGLCAQVTAEGAMYTGDLEATMIALQAADDAKSFDLIWFDRCPLLEPTRAHPAFAAIRANVAGRAQGIIAAYERARISSRVRA